MDTALGHMYGFLGLPRYRIVDSKPNVAAMFACQSSLPDKVKMSGAFFIAAHSQKNDSDTFPPPQAPSKLTYHQILLHLRLVLMVTNFQRDSGSICAEPFGNNEILTSHFRNATFGKSIGTSNATFV